MDTNSQQQQASTQEQQTSETASESGSVDMQRLKLNYLEQIAKHQEKMHEIHLQMLSSMEKANNRLHIIVENQRLERHNHDRMIELLYRIAYNK